MDKKTPAQAPLAPVETVSGRKPAIGMPFEWHPLPLVIETDGESAWAAWDASVRELDRLTPEGRAMALVNA